LAVRVGMENVTFNPSSFSTSTSSPNCTADPIPTFWGYIAAGVAILFYGSNNAPVKTFETGDGLFFQWVVCQGALIIGVVVYLIRQAPKFYPFGMLCGTIFVSGNLCVVPVIKTIGMGLGLCIWGMTNLVSGWATGRFGLFGVKPEPPDSSAMNYAGVALAICSAVTFIFVKNEISEVEIQNILEETEPLLNAKPVNAPDSPKQRIEDHTSFVDKLSPAKKRIVGIGLSLFSGLLYGQTFTPAIYVQDNYTGASSDALDYVLPYYVGSWLTSTVYFMIYSAVKRNRPMVYPKAILPGLASGLMWGVATACWFVSNKTLSEPVAFPIITTGPAVIASMWGVFLFKEIKGHRNIAILLLGFCFVGAGATLSGLSKIAKPKC
ncbi:hypothetical protein ScPMuIL_009237, partial [Solemya velum]